MAVDRKSGIADLGPRLGDLGPDHLELPLGLRRLAPCLDDLELGYRPIRAQLLGPRQFRALELQIAACRIQFRMLDLKPRLQCCHSLAGCSQLGLPAITLDNKALAVDREQGLPRFDDLIVLHCNVDYPARDLGGDDDQVGFDIGVLGRHVATGRHVEIKTRDADGDGAAD